MLIHRVQIHSIDVEGLMAAVNDFKCANCDQSHADYVDCFNCYVHENHWASFLDSERCYRCCTDDTSHHTLTTDKKGRIICSDCKEQLALGPLYFAFNHTLFRGRNTLMFNIHDYKEGGKNYLYYPLSNLLTYQINNLIDSVLKTDRGGYIVAPIPSFKNTRLHMEKLCDLIQDKINITIIKDVFMKVKNVRTKDMRSWQDRRAALHKAYVCTKDLDGKKIIIVDDLYTTGADLYYCAKAAKDSNADVVYGVTIARRVAHD